MSFRGLPGLRRPMIQAMASPRPGVTVLLPARDAARTLAGAAACILRQSFSGLELLLVLNGADGATRAAAERLGAGDPRVRIIHASAGNLASALNRGLREARANLVARMDADDECPPGRIAAQVAAMERSPDLAALGCAWEVADPHGEVLGVRTPPADPRESAWRLLIDNPFAHGSMLLRRDAVLAAGGYDESLDRAQDYDLWLRLRHAGVAAIPDVLYRHRLRAGTGFSSSPLQAAAAARLLLQAWNSLPDRADPATEPALAAALGEEGPARAGALLEEAMTRGGPTRALLQAWLWVQGRSPVAPRETWSACRDARLREFARGLAAAGVTRVWVYGAGSHTGRLLPALNASGVAIAGILDDSLTGASRHGFTVAPPAAVPAGAHVVLSSDAHEARLWSASAPLRARGAVVHRVYAAEAPPIRSLAG